jgi:hypothetical protein
MQPHRLQAARFLDPKYPVVRLQPTIPRLHFYLRCVSDSGLILLLQCAKRTGSLPGWLRVADALEELGKEQWAERCCHPCSLCSPGRIARLLRVVRAAFPSAEDPAGGVPVTAAGAQELWREHADHQGDVRVLTWGGIGRTALSWCPRFGIIYQASGWLRWRLADTATLLKGNLLKAALSDRWSVWSVWHICLPACISQAPCVSAGQTVSL